MATKQSASRNAPRARDLWRRRERGTLQGGGMRERQGRSTGGIRQLFRRLRRLELAVASSLSGKPKDFDLDQFLKAVLEVEQDARDDQGRSIDQGGAIQVPQERASSGEGPGEIGANGRSKSGKPSDFEQQLRRWLEETPEDDT